jgi:hypothetical protein
METDKYEGPISKALKVRTNDPRHPAANLQLNASVRSWIDVLPAWSATFQVDLGKEGRHELTLRGRDPEKPFQIIGATCDNPHVGLRFLPVAADAPGASPGDLRLVVTIDPEAPMGPLTGTVNISTTLAEQRRVRIPVAAQVLGPIRFFPAMLVMFADQTGRPPRLSGTIVLQAKPGGEPFEVTAVESDDARLRLEALTQGADPVHRVAATWTAPQERGVHEGTVRVRTSEALMPEIEVRYQVRIE